MEVKYSIIGKPSNLDTFVERLTLFQNNLLLAWHPVFKELKKLPPASTLPYQYLDIQCGKLPLSSIPFFVEKGWTDFNHVDRALAFMRDSFKGLEQGVEDVRPIYQLGCASPTEAMKKIFGFSVHYWPDIVNEHESLCSGRLGVDDEKVEALFAETKSALPEGVGIIYQLPESRSSAMPVNAPYVAVGQEFSLRFANKQEANTKIFELLGIG